MRFVTGTIAQLTNKLTMNGVPLDQPALSVMTRIFSGSLFKQVGIVKKEGKRGRSAIIWQVDTEAGTFFEVGADTSGLTLSDDGQSEVAATPEPEAATETAQAA